MQKVQNIPIQKLQLSMQYALIAVYCEALKEDTSFNVIGSQDENYTTMEVCTLLH